ncbi:MAG: PIG-L family deacetylase [Anaerolineae bacterium]|nr:PIG-L family deacetylase [Anaerolineae bacterium]
MTAPTRFPEMSILGVYAHPDDEQGISGTMRILIERGVRTGLVCATRGEVGEISDPTLATPESLGDVREDELRRAAAVIGIHEVHFLGYRDSGMAGSPPNDDPRAFIRADPVEAVGRIVRAIRRFQPTLVLTFDPSGVYGHPDHIAVNRWTTEAFHAAADTDKYPVAEFGHPFQPRRLYYSSVSRSLLIAFDQILRQQNLPSIFTGVDINQMGLPDEMITHRVMVAPYVALKRKSLEEHRTQMNPNTALAMISEEDWNRIRSVEMFALVAGDPLPPNADDQDLFTGLH